MQITSGYASEAGVHLNVLGEAVGELVAIESLFFPPEHPDFEQAIIMLEEFLNNQESST